MPLVEPVYGLTEGLAPRALAKIIGAALARLPKLPDWLAGSRAKPPNLPGFNEALEILHHPPEPEVHRAAGAGTAAARLRRIAGAPIGTRSHRAHLRRSAGRSSKGDGSRSGAIRAALPFALTAAQDQALSEIRADLAAPVRMLRLLQGDVGSGKTIVALLAMAEVVEAGRQAALMVPTEVLARQHFESLQKYAAPAGLKIALLTGRDTSAERTRTLAALASGEIDIIIAPHALFQDSVAFHDLGLAVVDEQHRFGVHQRLALAPKAAAPIF